MGITVLVVDDSDALRAAMRVALEDAGLDLLVVEAADGAQALSVALDGKVDLVVTDLVMPNLDGLGLLRAIRQQRDELALPVILVTSQNEPETRTLSLDAGANDYLMRPFSDEELVLRVRVAIRLRELAGELEKAKERYRRLSARDELTGAANRSAFLDACQQELSRTRRHRLPMAVLVADIDHLKRLNSRLGGRGADALIARVADILNRELRATDRLAHFEGGRFAVLLPQTDEPKAVLAAERFRQAVADHPFPGTEVGEVTLSLGLITYPQAGVESVEQLWNAAQAALDRAKAGGRNRLELWTSAVGSSTVIPAAR